MKIILAKSICSFFLSVPKGTTRFGIFFDHYLLHKCPLGNFSLGVRLFTSTHITPHRTKPKSQNIRPHPTTKHAIITTAAASSVAACAPGNGYRGRSPPAEPPTTMTTTKDDRVEVPNRITNPSKDGTKQNCLCVYIVKVLWSHLNATSFM